jgi:hypothetical protein
LIGQTRRADPACRRSTPPNPASVDPGSVLRLISRASLGSSGRAVGRAGRSGAPCDRTAAG